MYNILTIQSCRSQYTVHFVNNYIETLKNLLHPDDFLIIDTHVWELYPDIGANTQGVKMILLEPSELAKSFDALQPVLKHLIENHFTKSNRLIAIGGGVIQDITAFTASILLRGVKWSFFPTNLLTQCDSCIGSKTSINFGRYKNQLGGFYPPETVYIDLSFLKTLPDREIRSGIGEMMHYFLVSGESDFDWATPLIRKALDGQNVLGDLIYRSLQIKKDMIERDEFDQGPRNVFNYGHSFGHALEVATHYKAPHGIAVSYGMDLANIISAKYGLVPIAFRNRIRPILSEIWAGAPLAHLDSNAFLDALTHDKKNEGAEIKVILTRGFGQMFKTTLTMDSATKSLIKSFFADKLYEKNI